nr:hydroxymethylpyrimidine/phosphomethylpyrimidine kinase [uncultured Carboxylicivirga sp.]
MKSQINGIEMTRPFVLTIAGFDPSNGAGIGSDIKAIEQNNAYGLSVVTAITYQNESEFHGLRWLPFVEIKKQLESLASKYQPKCIKIGLVKNVEVLIEILDFINENWPKAYIIWDPILKATAGFEFHKNISNSIEALFAKGINLITPNIPEFKELFKEADPQTLANRFKCSLLIKGGHSTETSVCDELYIPDKKNYFILSDKVEGNLQKHGTGCVLSSVIASNLANQLNLKEACKEAHFYVKSFIASTPALLGYHSK